MRAEMNLHSSVDWAIHAELLDADPVVSRHDRFSTAHTIPEAIVREHLMRLRAEYNNGAPFPGVLRTYGTEHVLSVRDNGEFVCDVCMETVIGCLRCGGALDPAYGSTLGALSRRRLARAGARALPQRLRASRSTGATEGSGS